MKTQTSKIPRASNESVESRLLETAGQCFVEEGFGYGIDDILAKSGVAKMSLYTKFDSKFGLINRLLEDAATEWKREIDRVVDDHRLEGIAKVRRFLKNVCGLSRNSVRRTGLIAQALVEFPMTEKPDEGHRKRNSVQKKARQLQQNIVLALQGLCESARIKRPELAAEQILLLANGYFVSETVFGKPAAIKLTLESAKMLIGEPPGPSRSGRPTRRSSG